MIHKNIVYFGKPCVLACDANCQKAWGINNRPRIYLTDPTLTVYPIDRQHYPDDENIDPDDTAMLADGELGDAPIDPGTYEGDHGKPFDESDMLNKWCARECERSDIADFLDDIELRDFSQRVYNTRDGKPLAS